MEKQLGYYSIIQFCPELSQLEALNVGVVLFCPEKKFRNGKNDFRPRKNKENVSDQSKRTKNCEADALAVFRTI
jgi:hypothetical protein